MLRRVDRPLAYVAARPLLALLLPALTCCVLACLYVFPFGFPPPRVADEFSYLLGADTFASGRVANPTHPLWVYLESPHIIHVPSYVSMYHPAQALVLAAGWRIFGHPWYGVLASVFGMCVALSWALRVWLPPRWALLGALIAIQIAVFGKWSPWTGYWAASYWGGAVAATGGALVIGALGRLRRHLRVLDALLFAAGVAILASSRPYEGFLLTVTAAAVLFVALWRQNVPFILMLRKCVLPAAAILALTGAAMVYYCWRTTGNPLRLPYQESLRQYGMRRMFVWGENQPKTYRHVALQRVYQALLRKEISFRGKVVNTVKRISLFYFGPLLLSLPMLFRVVRDRRIRPPLIAGLVVLAGLSLVEWVHIHYLAPITCVLILVCVQCLRHIGAIRPRGIPLGRVAAFSLLAASFLFTAASAAANRGWYRNGWPRQRAEMQQELVRAGSKHLVIVRYADRHNPHDEWVYNAADIDGSPVVWAREMSDNRPLLDYFAARKTWLLEVDSHNPHPVPYRK